MIPKMQTERSDFLSERPSLPSCPFPRLHRATRELGLADASLLFVHNVQGNLAVNRLLGWRRGSEFAHAQELLSAYSEGGHAGGIGPSRFP